MSALDMLDDSFPHGTVDGYRSGCKSGNCPAAMACRDVHTRYSGDYAFQRQVDAGVPVADILASEEAERAGAAERDRAAARAARRTLKAPKKSKSRVERAPEPSVLEKLGPEIVRMHGEGKIDREIAVVLGLSHSRIGVLRRALGLPRVERERLERPRKHRTRIDRGADVTRLHALGMRDVEIAAELGLVVEYIGAVRRAQGLAPHSLPRTRKPRPPRAERVDARPLIAAWHAEGLSDRAMADRVGLSKSRVAELRRQLGLAPIDGPRAPSSRVLQPHGTNASYARGCRCKECDDAQREYYREYSAKRRAKEVDPQHHGTPYGYQLGCRSRRTCPGEVSCIDASLAEERRRRREAGKPEQAPRVPAGPVREHARALLNGGMTVHALADTAGISRSGLKVLLYGRSGPRKGEFPAEIEAEKARRLLALERSA